MDLSGETTIERPVGVVYSFLMDPVRLSQCIPGFQKLENVGDDTFTIRIKAGVSMIRGTFTVNLKIFEKDEGRHAKLRGDGRGTAGTIDFMASIDVSELNSSTTLRWSATVNIGGKIASLAQGLLKRQAEKIVNEFFENVRNSIYQEIS